MMNQLQNKLHKLSMFKETSLKHSLWRLNVLLKVFRTLRAYTPRINTPRNKDLTDTVKLKYSPFYALPTIN